MISLYMIKTRITYKIPRIIKTGKMTGKNKYSKILNKHMKRWSISLIIREMQIKTTMRCHLSPVRMTIIKKSTNNC